MKDIEFRVKSKDANGDVFPSEVLLGQSWEVKKPEGVVIIVTGMLEHAKRYDGFATFLNSKNFNVYCIDHYGQGRNNVGKEIKGMWPEHGFFKAIENIHQIKNEFEIEGKPCVIFGHSMGSFMTQGFLETYGDEKFKAVICGSNFGSNSYMQFGKGVAKMVTNKKNWNKPSPFLNNLTTGGFNKGIKNSKTDFDWLSYNEENVRKYIADEDCGFVATTGFYMGLIEGMASIWNPKNLAKINKENSIFIIAGEEDPVGSCGKGPSNLFKTYKEKLGIKNVELKLYKHARHEILNEDLKEEVYNDIFEFIKK